MIFGLLLYSKQIHDIDRHLKSQEKLPKPYINPRQEKSGNWIWFVIGLGLYFISKGELP